MKKQTIEYKTKYGIGEWYGKRIDTLTPSERQKYAKIKGKKKILCPHFSIGTMCNKSGGVCSLIQYKLSNNKEVCLCVNTSDFVTTCPLRFWQDYKVFKKAGEIVLGTSRPTLIKEIGFLQRITHSGEKTKEIVGRIDMVLANTNTEGQILDWCGLEIQAVYFSGRSMSSDFKAIAKNPRGLVFPQETRRPDFRSSGPKRLMPQLQIKVPTLRRWGKKMVVVIDKPFFESLAPMETVEDITNSDIVWIIVNYKNGSLYIDDSIYTTLESSVIGLTSGLPLSLSEFETELTGYLNSKKDKIIVLK